MKLTKRASFMQDLIIICILIVIILIAVMRTIYYFKGKSICCETGNTYISKKKLKKVIGKKTYIIDGMSCENCGARVLRYINDIEGVVGKIKVRKKELVVFMEREVLDDEIIDAVNKAGYQLI